MIQCGTANTNAMTCGDEDSTTAASAMPLLLLLLLLLLLIDTMLSLPLLALVL
jgi:hypothetical protein